MKFIDKDHKNFYKEKISEYGNVDCYYKALIYTLGICETTRKHFKEIFGNRREINFDSLQSAWQTGTSEKVTRMAFNLWNSSSMFDSEKECEQGKISKEYSPSEIFCCSYAPYFYEGIKLRYPEYTRENINEFEKYIDEVEEE